MEHTRLKLKIHHDQLFWFLAILLNEREIFKILRGTNVVADPDRLHSSSKQELLSRLTTAFFRQSDVDEIVVQYLSNKAKSAISRVGIMVIDEIHTFFKSPGPLIESGEFGEVVWALMTDSREDVHSHGMHLLTAAYETHNQPENLVDRNSDSRLQHRDIEQYNLAPYPSNANMATPHLPVEEVHETLNWEEGQINTQQQKKEIEDLKLALSNLEKDYTKIEKEYKKLQNHCQLLREANEELKSQEAIYQQNEKQIVLLQKENQTLQKKSGQYEETNVALTKLETEHQQLKKKCETITTELSQLSQIKASKESFLVELKLVEEAVYNEFQALEQLKTDLEDHFSSIGKSYEVSRNALNQIRQTVDHFDELDLVILENPPEHSGTQERVGVFVDVQNMFYAAKDRFERRVDYIKLLDLIVGPRQLIAAYAYIVQIPEIKQSNFISLLEHNGYTIRSKDLRLRGDGSAKGDWDVGIAVDVVSMLSNLDVVILASGDGDFCPLAELIKQQHKRIEVVAFEHNTSMDLQTMADQFFPIGEELLM